MTKRWVLAAVLTTATLAAYANSLSNPFVFDDQGAIVENETIRTLSIATALAPTRQSATAGRPLVNLSLAINYAAGGLSPWGYRTWNLSVHILCGLLLFGIVRRTLALLPATTTPAAAQPTPPGGKKRRTPAAAGAEIASRPAADAIAFVAALLWLLHPLQTELIDYVIQRTESMMALACLATLYAAIRTMTARQPTASTAARATLWASFWTTAAIAACVAGMMCKESMVTAPLLVLLFDTAFVSGSPRRSLKTRPLLYGGLAASWIVLVFMIADGPRSHSAGFSAGVSVWTYLLNHAPIIVRYLRTAIWPTSLVFDYGTPRPLAFAAVIVPGSVVVVLLLATVWAWRAHRPLAFLGTWLFVTLAPSSSIVPIATEVGAERRMYLPLAALVVTVVVAASRVAMARRWVPVAAAVVVVVAIGLGGLTVRRNAEYSSGLRLWQTVVDRYPHGRAHYGLAMALKAEGRLPEAMHEFEVASTDYPEADYAIGFERANQGRHADALTYLQRYVKARPDDLNVIRAYNLIGRSQLLTGAFEQAAASFHEVLRMQAGNVDALGGLADALNRLDRTDEAIAAYQEYVRLGSSNVEAWVNLGLALARQGRHAEAVNAFAAAIALDPRAAGPHVNLASSLATLQRFEDAIVEGRRAIALEPDPAGRAEIESLIRLIASDKATGASR